MTISMNIPARLAFAVLCVFSVMSSVVADESDSQTEFDIGAYRGDVVVVDFWASWCVPCRRSFPWLNAMHDKYAAEGLVIVGVNVDKDRALATEFMRDYPARFRIRYDPEGRLAKEFGVPGMPTSYVIGRDGRLLASHIGFKVRKQDEYEAAIVAALAEESQ